MRLIKFLKENIRKEIIIGFIIILFILWSFILVYYSPQKIVSMIGTNNGYLIVFVLGIIGGTAILIPFPYYIFIITFGAGGLNPFLLGIFAAIGDMIGDSTSYGIGYHGSIILSGKIQKKINKFAKHCSTKSNFILLSLFLFLYGALIPIPNDVVILPLSAAKYKYWKLMIPLGLGNIVFDTLLAFSGFYGWHLFFG
jgi:membrane protein YqaA with SNARE-associated domain